MASTSEFSDRYANKVVSIGAVPLVIPPPGEGVEGGGFCCALKIIEAEATHKKQAIPTIFRLFMSSSYCMR
jgi:hypothetical protein